MSTTLSSSSSMAATNSIVICKLVIIGDSSVGKTSLLGRFFGKPWSPDEVAPTVGAKFHVHKMKVNEKKVKLIIWDTAGEEKYRAVASSYYRGAHGVILVYDISKKESFEALPRWYKELKTYVSESAVKIVVGNKVDMESSRKVEASEGEAFALGMDSLFIETSAMTAVGVRETFMELAEKILDTPELWNGDPVSGSVDVGSSEPQSKPPCGC